MVEEDEEGVGWGPIIIMSSFKSRATDMVVLLWLLEVLLTLLLVEADLTVRDDRRGREVQLERR